jgi:hypothetical protein
MALFLYDNRSICLLAFLVLEHYKQSMINILIPSLKTLLCQPSILSSQQTPTQPTIPTNKKKNQQVPKCAVKNTRPTDADAFLIRFTNVCIKSKQVACFPIV